MRILAVYTTYIYIYECKVMHKLKYIIYLLWQPI